LRITKKLSVMAVTLACRVGAAGKEPGRACVVRSARNLAPEGSVAIHDHLETFAGRPVVDFDDQQQPADPGGVAWRLTAEIYGAPEGRFEDVFERFLAAVDPARVEALVIGAWTEALHAGAGVDNSAARPVRALCAAAGRFSRLRSLFLGDITMEESEISWIPQTDVTPLLESFPALERLRVRGADGLELRPVRHDHLVELAFESGGLPPAVVRAVGACDLPKLEHLELWLGTPTYGGDTTVADLSPILSGARFPRLRYLGLRDSEIADELAAAVATAPVVGRLEVLDLSMGTLGDTGAEALVTGQPLTHLRRLDLHHHFMSAAMTARLEGELRAAGVDVDLTRPADEDQEDRYVAVSE
jgi:hypothetical protein